MMSVISYVRTCEERNYNRINNETALYLHFRLLKSLDRCFNVFIHVREYDDTKPGKLTQIGEVVYLMMRHTSYGCE